MRDAGTNQNDRHCEKVECPRQPTRQSILHSDRRSRIVGRDASAHRSAGLLRFARKDENFLPQLTHVLVHASLNIICTQPSLPARRTENQNSAGCRFNGEARQ